MTHPDAGRVRVTALSNADLIRALVDAAGETVGYSFAELSEITGLSDTTVRDYVRALRRRKLVAVVSWGEDPKGARTIREFAFAPDKKDKPQPRMTQAERQARYRGKKRKQRELLRSAGAYAVAGLKTGHPVVDEASVPVGLG